MERDFFIVKKCPEFGLKMTVKKKGVPVEKRP
jgi:hypothetical protein